MPHLCANIGVPGVAIFTVSDPNKFGRKANKNLIKDNAYLRPDQYGTWNDCKYNPDASIKPEKVLQAIKEVLATKK